MTRKGFLIHISLTIFLGLVLSSAVVLAAGEATTRPQLLRAAEPKSVRDIGIQSTALWNQTDTTGGVPVNASNTSGYDHLVADDFVITDTVNNYWQVTGVRVDGEYSPSDAPAATSVNLQFYTDAVTTTITTTKHIPGTLIYNGIINTTLVSGPVTITLPSPVLL